MGGGALTRTRLGLIAVTLLAWGGSLWSGFHLDDYSIFRGSLTEPAGVLDLWGLKETRPLTNFTQWANYQLGGRNAVGYHAVNLALHLGAVLLAYECLRRLLPGRAAWIAAGIFAVHPIQAEAVDYVWGRAIVLAALLCLASLAAWMGGRPWEAVGWF